MAGDIDALKRLSEGNQLLQAGDTQESILRFNEVMALQPNLQTLRGAYFGRVEALRRLGRHAEAWADEERWDSVAQAAIEARASAAPELPQPTTLPTARPVDITLGGAYQRGRQAAIGGRYCSNCGTENLAGGNFCASCGARLSPSSSAPRTSAVRLSLARVALFTMLSFGLYILYWFYLTWKQLQPETRDQHYPVWHALSLAVPIYNLFRMHRHVTVIRELALGVGLTPSVSAGGAVVLFFISSALDSSALFVSDQVTLVVLSVISLAATTALIVWAQGSLNRYWETVEGGKLTYARIGRGEVLIVLLGLLAWVGTLVPV